MEVASVDTEMKVVYKLETKMIIVAIEDPRDDSGNLYKDRYDKCIEIRDRDDSSRKSRNRDGKGIQSRERDDRNISIT